jgi:hypothetical protein
VHWLWGILLGLVLTAALPIVAALLSLNDRVVNQDESLLAAIALVLFCLLGVLIFKPAESTKPARTLRGRGREDEE